MDKSYENLGWAFSNPRDVEGLRKQAAAIRRMVVSLIQEVAVVKSMLEDKQIWDADVYRQFRIQRMIDDHVCSGASPWEYHSYYPHAITEEDFLRTQLDATDDEIEDFTEEVEFLENMS